MIQRSYRPRFLFESMQAVSFVGERLRKDL
jgi:hypothetical protein